MGGHLGPTLRCLRRLLRVCFFWPALPVLLSGLLASRQGEATRLTSSAETGMSGESNGSGQPCILDANLTGFVALCCLDVNSPESSTKTEQSKRSGLQCAHRRRASARK